MAQEVFQRVKGVETEWESVLTLESYSPYSEANKNQV